MSIYNLWGADELDGMTEKDKKLLQKYVNDQAKTNSALLALTTRTAKARKRILRTASKPLKDRLVMKSAEPTLAENVTRFKKTP